MKKILFIHHGYGLGGASIALVEMLRPLREKFDLRICCITDSDAVEFFRREGFATDVLDHWFYRRFYRFFCYSDAMPWSPRMTLHRYILSFLLNRYWFAPRVLRNYQFDMLYTNTTFLPDWAAVGKAMGKKVIVHVREPLKGGRFHPITNFFFRKVFRKNCDRIVAISHDNAKRIGVPEKTIVIYDALRSHTAERTKPGFIPDPSLNYFLYLGGDAVIKGLQQLAGALQFLSPDVRILWGGNFQLPECRTWRQKIKRLIRCRLFRVPDELKIMKQVLEADNITLLGFVPDIYSYLSISRAMLSPFAYPHFSCPVMEAYRMGKPVIVSDVSGMAEIVTPETGIMFRNGDSRALAEAINRMAAHEQPYPAEVCLRYYRTFYENNPELSQVIATVFKDIGISGSSC